MAWLYSIVVPARGSGAEDDQRAGALVEDVRDLLDGKVAEEPKDDDRSLLHGQSVELALQPIAFEHRGQGGIRRARLQIGQHVQLDWADRDELVDAQVLA